MLAKKGEAVKKGGKAGEPALKFDPSDKAILVTGETHARELLSA